MNDVDIITRNISIDILLDIENPLVTWFDEIWRNLAISKTKVGIDQEWTVYYNIHGDYSWIFCHRENELKINPQYWTMMHIQFRFSNYEIEKITSHLAMYKLNCKIDNCGRWFFAISPSSSMLNTGAFVYQINI
jgi:hypothetical protein